MPQISRKYLCGLGIVALAASTAGQQLWLAAGERKATTDGRPVEFPLPTPNSGPTTLALAPDGVVWFTQSSGNRIGRMNPDGSGLREFPLPQPDSSPRIIALGSDGNMWFSEHTGNRMGRPVPRRARAAPSPPSESGTR